MDILNDFLNLQPGYIFLILWGTTGFILATVMLFRMPDLYSDEDVPFICWLGTYAMYIKAPWIALIEPFLYWYDRRQEKKAQLVS